MLAKRSATSTATGRPNAARESKDEPRFALYGRAHLLLRGRYRYVLPLVILFGLAGAGYGYRSKQALYASDGLIHVAPKLPEVMQQTDQNAPMRMYLEFVQTQVLLMQSKSVMELAKSDPQLLECYKEHPAGIDGFAGDLFITYPPRTESITISYLTSDPHVAVASVRALIGAYMKTYQKGDEIEQRRRFGVLADRKEALTRQIAEVTQQMQQSAIIPSAKEIAYRDDLMGQYVAEQIEVQTDLNAMLNRGLGPNEPEVKGQSIRLRDLNEKIESYRQSYGRMALATAMRPRDFRKPNGLFPELRGLEQSLDRLTGELNETTQRQDMLATEARLGVQRVTVQDWGSVAAEPAFDQRLSTAATFGGIAGAAPLLLFLAFGAIERRYRYSDQAQDSPDGLPLLGVIPELSNRMDEQERSRISAHSAHNIRIRLQTINGAEPHGLFMITSAAAGEGKTSLTLSLGFSFAASGARTLMIDCDTIGRGLTHRLEAEDAPGLIDCLDDPGDAVVKKIADDLWLLPAGRPQTNEQMVLTPQKLRDLVAAARDAHDVVLIDTGPILCGPEASVIAEIADRVVLVIARGQAQKDSAKAIAMLRSVGARTAGFVFNRSAADDYHRSIGGASNAYYNSAAWPVLAPPDEGQAPAPSPPTEPAPTVAPAAAAASDPHALPATPWAGTFDNSAEAVAAFADPAAAAVITQIDSALLLGAGKTDMGGRPAAFTFFSEQPLSATSVQSPTVVMTVINGPIAGAGNSNSGSEGFAARRPDGQIDAASAPGVDPAGKSGRAS